MISFLLGLETCSIPGTGGSDGSDGASQYDSTYFAVTRGRHYVSVLLSSCFYYNSYHMAGEKTKLLVLLDFRVEELERGEAGVSALG